MRAQISIVPMAYFRFTLQVDIRKTSEEDEIVTFKENKKCMHITQEVSVNLVDYQKYL